MAGGKFLCKLEVFRGPSECTVRSFSIDRTPRTILETINLLKSHDLRLQYGPFELSVAYSQEEERRQLFTDEDVVAFFSLRGCSCFVFRAVMSNCDSGVGNSMLVDDTLVTLSIKSMDGGPAVTKRFVAPSRDIHKALVLAVRDVLPHVLLAEQKLQLFSVDGDTKGLREIRCEEDATLLVRSCMAERGICRLSYRVVGGNPQLKVPKATPKYDEGGNKRNVNNVYKGNPTNRNAGPECDGMGAENAHISPRVQLEYVDSSKPVTAPQVGAVEDAKPVTAPQVGAVEDAKPVTAPQVGAVEDAKPVTAPQVGGVKNREAMLSVLGGVLPKAGVFDTRGVRNLTDALSGGGPHSGKPLLSPNTKEISLGETASAFYPLNNSQESLAEQTVGGEKAVTETVASGKEAADSSLKEGGPPRVSSGKNDYCNFSDDELPEEVVVEVACSLEKAVPVQFFFTWSKASQALLKSFYDGCNSALNLTDVDHVILYNGNGIPLCSPRDVTSMVWYAIKSGRSRIDVSAVRGHPCTSGLPLQCLFTWGTQQVLQALVLRPAFALDDIRAAITEECRLKGKDVGELSFRLVHGEELDCVELTVENSYRELRRAAEQGSVVRITVLDRRRTSLIAFAVRSLSDAASVLASEVECAFGYHFTEMDIVPVLTRCSDFLASREDDVKRYVDAVTANLQKPRVLKGDDVVKAVLDAAPCCTEDVVLPFVNCCIAATQLMSSHRPFEVLTRFFRRLYRSISYPERTEKGIPLNVVTRQLAYAGLSDAKWLLFRDQPFSSVVYERDFVEMLQRLYAGNPNLVCRVCVAFRLSGISSLKSRRVMSKEERDAQRQHCRKEIAHAFDGIRGDEIVAYIHHYRLQGRPNHCYLLSTVSTLLANCSERLSAQWFIERATERYSVSVEPMLRNFEDAQIPLPLLYQLCWDVLRPDLHHLTLLSESHVASAFAYWALFAVQLICINRNLEFPPVPLVDLKQFTWAACEKAPVGSAVTEMCDAVAIALPAPQPPSEGKRKIKYKYSYLCHDLRRDQRFLPMIR